MHKILQKRVYRANMPGITFIKQNRNACEKEVEKKSKKLKKLTKMKQIILPNSTKTWTNK